MKNSVKWKKFKALVKVEQVNDNVFSVLNDTTHNKG